MFALPVTEDIDWKVVFTVVHNNKSEKARRHELAISEIPLLLVFLNFW